MATFVTIDPSLCNTAVVKGRIEDDVLIPEDCYVHITEQPKNKKQVRASSILINRGRSILTTAKDWVEEAKPDIIFAETPSGSQSHSGAISYAVSCMFIASLTSPAPIEITPQEVKNVLGKGKYTKKQIIAYVEKRYPNFLPRKSNGEIHEGQSEHIADAIVAAEAGIKTTQYLQIKNLLKGK